MRTDAFGIEGGTATPAPSQAGSDAPKAPPVDTSTPATTTAQPIPAPAPAPAPPQPAPTPAPAPAPAPSPAPTTNKGKGAAKTGMPPVGNVTKANPTGAAPTSDGTPRPNDTRLEELVKGIAELGTAEGAGVNSRPELAIRVADAVRQGIISAHTKSEDVANIYNAFRTAKMEAQGDFSGEKEKSNEQQVSKLRLFAKLGDPANKFDPVKALTTARIVINEDKSSKNPQWKKSTYEGMLLIASAIKKSGKVPTKPQMKEMLAPPERTDVPLEADENEVVQLEKVEKRILFVLDGSDDFGPRESAEVRKAVELIHARILKVRNEIEARRPKAPTPPVSPPAGQVNQTPNVGTGTDTRNVPAPATP